MENQKIRALCPRGRVVLPRKLISEIGWEPGQRLTAMVNLRHKTVEFFSKEDGGLQIGELGILTIPKGFRDALDWEYRDRLAVTVDATEGTVLLALHKKFVPKCVFCGKPEDAMTINGMNICNEHVAIIRNSSHNKFRNTPQK